MEETEERTFFIPKLLWLSPRREGPTCYVLVSLNVETFIVGGLIGVYIACRKGFYAPRNVSKKRVSIDADLKVLEEEARKEEKVFPAARNVLWNIFCGVEAVAVLTPYFLETGLVHCFVSCAYRIVTLSDGKLVPSAFTYLVLTSGDEDFQYGWTTMLHVTVFAAVVECIRLFIFSESFRIPVAQPFMSYIVEPMLSVMYPPKWLFPRITGCRT